MRRRVGIDVGGTNTDAVLLEDDGVAAAVKTPTTPDVTTGITKALGALVARAPVARETQAVMIGTTHFTNAVVVARAASWKWMERISRKACVEVGSIASTCKAPRTGKEIKECAVLGSTTKAIGIGRAVQAARRAHRDPIEAVLEVASGLKL
ncbi:MAG TPA: hydantoinase/oxoprolinase N-terminal domain-containing protein, partial [Methylomirabilota bacterium]